MHGICLSNVIFGHNDVHRQGRVCCMILWKYNEIHHEEKNQKLAICFCIICDCMKFHLICIC